MKRVPSIDHRDDLARFTKLGDGHQILIILWNHENSDVFTRRSFYPGPEEQDLEQGPDRTSDEEVGPIRLERPPVGEDRAMRDQIQYQIILFSIFGEVFPGGRRIPSTKGPKSGG